VQALAERIAEALRGTRPDGENTALELWADLVVAVAAALAQVDPGFDFGAFFTACGGL
jgi:hypothetical protein